MKTILAKATLVMLAMILITACLVLAGFVAREFGEVAGYAAYFVAGIAVTSYVTAYFD